MTEVPKQQSPNATKDGTYYISHSSNRYAVRKLETKRMQVGVFWELEAEHAPGPSLCLLVVV